MKVYCIGQQKRLVIQLWKRQFHFTMTKRGLSFKKSKLCGQKLFKTKETKMLSPFTGLYLRRWREGWDLNLCLLILFAFYESLF